VLNSLNRQVSQQKNRQPMLDAFHNAIEDFASEYISLLAFSFIQFQQNNNS
jgi:hypothetical protein